MEILLGIILFFVVLWYGFKLFLRYGLPWLLARFMKNQQSRFGNFNQQQADNRQRPDGEVQVKKEKSQKPKDNDGFGEYVDFEDVEE